MDESGADASMDGSVTARAYLVGLFAQRIVLNLFSAARLGGDHLSSGW